MLFLVGLSVPRRKARDSRVQRFDTQRLPPKKAVRMGTKAKAALPLRPKQCPSCRIVGAVEPDCGRRSALRPPKSMSEGGTTRSDRAIITPAPHRTLIPVKVPCSNRKLQIKKGRSPVHGQTGRKLSLIVLRLARVRLAINKKFAAIRRALSR